MAKEIVNRVAQSSLITFDLEDHYPKGERKTLDLSQWLEQGLILREKSFRAALKAFDFSPFQDTYVALHCTSDALLPAWANLLVVSYLQPFAKKVVWGSLNELETVIFHDLIQSIDIEPYKDKPLIIKGCADKHIPASAFVTLVERLQPHVKSLMYGEACSSVPLFKK